MTYKISEERYTFILNLLYDSKNFDIYVFLVNIVYIIVCNAV